MTVEHFLDLDGGDVLCIADDDVLEAPRDADVSGGIDRAEVPGVEPSFGIKRSLIERRIDIAGEALWTSKEKLAFIARFADVLPARRRRAPRHPAPAVQLMS